MIREPKRIAVTFAAWNRLRTSRLMHGVLQHFIGLKNFVIRDFPFNDDAVCPEGLKAWRPHGIINTWDPDAFDWFDWFKQHEIKYYVKKLSLNEDY